MARNFTPPTPTKVRAAGLEWVSSYNCHSTTIAGWLSLGVNYSCDRNEPGYKVVVNGRQLKNNSPSFSEGAERAVAVARAWVAKAAEELKAADLAPSSSDQNKS